MRIVISFVLEFGGAIMCALYAAYALLDDRLDGAISALWGAAVLSILAAFDVPEWNVACWPFAVACLWLMWRVSPARRPNISDATTPGLKARGSNITKKNLRL
jgi:hypothetical protein